MRSKRTLEEQEAQAITRLVDARHSDGGTGKDGGFAARPEVRRQVEAQRRVSRELRDGGPAVPDRLLLSVRDKGRERHGAGAESPRRRLTSGSWRPRVAVSAVAALCAAVVIGVVGIGGGTSRPSI